MQFFQSIREFFKLIGIHPLQLEHASNNLRNVVVLLFMTLSSISCGAFVIYKADNIQDYSASFYTFITELICVGCFLSFRSNTTTLFELMDEFEVFIDESELEFIQKLIHSNEQPDHHNYSFSFWSKLWFKNVNLIHRFQWSDRTGHLSQIKRKNWKNIQHYAHCIDKNKRIRTYNTDNHHFICQFLCDWFKCRRIISFTRANDVSTKSIEFWSLIFSFIILKIELVSHFKRKGTKKKSNSSDFVFPHTGYLSTGKPHSDTLWAHQL